ncbi:MAG: hypothetical protein GX028_06010 [Clostridiaceae bacterium]|nr:hypothetical protein [Clostridiaceae bacterium]
MVDQDFIGNIRSAEQQADELIEAAKEQAAKSIEDARVRAAEIVASARKQAELEQADAMSAAQKEVDSIEAEAIQINELDVPDHVISDAADAVAERIVKYSVDR